VKATITLEDTETGNVTISWDLSEPVIDKTQSVATLLAMAIIVCACKAGGINVSPPEDSETHEYEVMSIESFRETLSLIRKRVLASAGKQHE